LTYPAPGEPGPLQEILHRCNDTRQRLETAGIVICAEKRPAILSLAEEFYCRNYAIPVIARDSEPYNNTARRLVDPQHVTDLVISLGNVALVDADSVDP